MRRRILFTTILIWSATALSVASADEDLDFFRRFLDASPSTNPQTSHLAQDWLRDVADSAPHAQARHSSDEQPILVAATPVQEVVVAEDAKPLREPIVPLPLPSSAADDASGAVSLAADQPLATGSSERTGEQIDAELRVAIRPIRDLIMRQPKPPKSPTDEGSEQPSRPSDADSAKAVTPAQIEKMEASVRQRMESLQKQLQAAEKRLETRLARFAKQREAALEKGDEEILQKIEATEQKFVSDYEREVQQLLSSAMPAGQSAAPAPSAATSLSDEEPAPPAPVPTRQPIQKPVSQYRKPQVTKLPVTKLPPNWSKSRLKASSLGAPNPKVMLRPHSGSGPAPKVILKPRNAASAAPPTTPRPQPTSPPKKRFKLWPF